MTRPDLIAACERLQDRASHHARLDSDYWHCTRAWWLCERALVTLGERHHSNDIDISIARATREIEL